MHRLHYPNLVRWACHLPALAEDPIWDSYCLAPQSKKGSTELARTERCRWRIDTCEAERVAMLRLAWLAGREVKFRPKVSGWMLVVHWYDYCIIQM